MTLQTMISTEAANNFGALVEYAIKGGATIIQRYKRNAAVLIGHEEYQRFKALEAALLAESREIEARNDRDGTWIPGEEMDRRMAAHVVVVD